MLIILVRLKGAFSRSKTLGKILKHSEKLGKTRKDTERHGKIEKSSKKFGKIRKGILSNCAFKEFTR